MPMSAKSMSAKSKSAKPTYAKPILRVLAVVAAASLASGASAQDRCTGTLCDAYYGGSPPAKSTVPEGATPMMVPSGGILGFFTSPKAEPAAPAGTTGTASAPAKAPMVAVEGGGLVGMMRGAPAERCTGTFCDFFYGGPPPEQPQPRQAATGTASRDAGAIDRGDIDRSPPPRSRNRRAEADEGGVSYAPRLAEKPQCVAPPGDPWKCYRK